MNEHHHHEHHHTTRLNDYFPLLLIVVYITLVSFINNFHRLEINWAGWMSQFMAGFFLVFSGFKLLDIHGFANGYANYDLLSRRWFAYGYIYPFLEFALGLFYLMQPVPNFILIATIILMGFSSLGVINSLLKKQQYQCACLGTVIKVPLSTVTLFEDLLMVILALWMILI